MSRKHTPGPWKATYIGDKMVGFSEIMSSNQLQVAEHVWTMDDARLIAAAPELLNLLTLITSKVGRINNLQYAKLPIKPQIWAELYQLQNQARKAITQATGPAGESE